MIDLSFTKMLLVAVIALLVLGPEKLPKAARMAGVMLRRVRSSWDKVRAEVERELEAEEIRRSVRRVNEGAKSFENAVHDTLNAVGGSVNAAAGTVQAQTAASSLPPADAERDKPAA